MMNCEWCPASVTQQSSKSGVISSFFKAATMHAVKKSTGPIKNTVPLSKQFLPTKLVFSSLVGT